MMKKAIFILSFIATGVMQLNAQSADSLRMDSVIHSLPEVMVTGERPMVKAKNGALVYDLPRMIEKKGVDNVYDALKELPGVTEKDENLQLSGQSVRIILDGKVTTMTAEQLNTLLKSLPASRIENVEVLYNAPAKYQVRGMLINVKLRHHNDDAAALQGEANLAWNQKHDAEFGERASLLYDKGHWSMDFMYLHSHGKSYSTTDETSIHALDDGTTHDIDTHECSHYKSYGHTYRLGINYDIAKDHQLSLVYNGDYEKDNTNQNVSGSVIADFRIRGSHWLHNVRLDYHAPFGLKAGAEMTYYHNPETQWLNSTLPTGTLDYEIDNDQRINRWKFFLSQEHELADGWGINYGATYTVSHDNSHQIVSDKKDEERQREDNANIYFGFNKNFSKKLMLDASLAAEYYHTSVWHQWDFFPTLNITWLPKPGHVFQFGLSSDKRYPEYWAVSNFITYSNGGYNEIVGNPQLKPSISYQAQLVYVLKSKYQFVAWCKHTKDYFTQTPYQRHDRLTVQYQYLNLNYQQQAGIQASAPFKFGQWLDSRLTLIGVWMRDKDDDYYDIPLDRSIMYGMARLNNTFTLSREPDITLSVDGMIRSKAIQVIYDLPASGNLDLSLRYKFMKKKAALRLFCNDILETSQISPRIDYRNQHLTMDFSCYRTFGVSFTYNFGGYKERKHEGVDTSRFKNATAL